jgi:hypothetical protein
MAGQKRHWVHTVNKGHLGDEEMTDGAFTALVKVLIEGLEEDTRCRWFSGQLEVGEAGNFHAQCYSEWHTSLRISEVIKAIPSHVETREGTRTQAMVYTQNPEKEGFVSDLGSIGEWLPDAEESARLSGGKSNRTLAAISVAAIVDQGMTPEEIALEHPHAFFTHYPKILALYEYRNQGIRKNDLSNVYRPSFRPVGG